MILRVFIVLCSVLISFLVYHDQCRNDHHEPASTQFDSADAIMTAIRFESCFNGDLDPHEADVDCGAACSSKCNIDQKCVDTSDCVQLPYNTTCTLRGADVLQVDI
eukprot:SAG11_NODE_10392_length_835_cov_0.921196_1_plen_105_part_10